MTTLIPIAASLAAKETMEGAGVRLRRVFGFNDAPQEKTPPAFSSFPARHSTNPSPGAAPSS